MIYFYLYYSDMGHDLSWNEEILLFANMSNCATPRVIIPSQSSKILKLAQAPNKRFQIIPNECPTFKKVSKSK